MSTTVETAETRVPAPMTTAAGDSPHSPDAPPRGRGRAMIAVTLVVALALSAALQQWAYSYRTAAINRNRPEGAPAAPRLANLDSFSLALLLGGLRGPLVMFLWTNSESQKSEKDLESFDTQVELIRLLQPEFDSVHIFQIWNKAYNVSVQMAALSNKYATILDALEYARLADQANPNNINLMLASAGLYADKLGNSAEKDFYRRRVRTETLPVWRVTFPANRVDAFRKAVADAGLEADKVRVTTDAGAGTATATLDKLGGDRVLAAFAGDGVTKTAVTRQSLRPPSRSGRRFEMDTLLDANGNILPERLAPTRPVPPGVEANDGSELQYLAQFQPFPYGVSPIALGYNYFKRGQVLQRVGKQKHLQFADSVVDNQPAMTLKMWAEEEWDRGRRLEVRGLPRTPNADGPVRELRTSTVPPDAKVVDRAAIDEAIFSYNRAALLAAKSEPEFVKHIENFPSKLQNFYSHTDNLKAIANLTAADAKYLEAMVAPTPAARAALVADAKAAYARASLWFHVLMLKYYVDDFDAVAVGYSRADVQSKTLDELVALFARVNQYLDKTYKGAANGPHAQDIVEYLENIQRINDRLRLLG